MTSEKNPKEAAVVRDIPPRNGVSVGKPRKVVAGQMRVAGCNVGSGSGGMFGGGSGGLGSSIMGSGGNFYSPELSTDFLELPQSDEERWNYFRFFYDHDPFVGQAIDQLDELPLSKIRLRKPLAKSPDIANAALDFCQKWSERVGLLSRLMAINHEWNLIGEAHIFCEDVNPEMPEDLGYEVVHEIAEDGSIVERRELLPDGQEQIVAWLRKNYKGWSAVRCLPPEQIHLESFPFTDEKLVELIPDSKTRAIVDRADSGDPAAVRIVESMPQTVVEAIRAGNNIPLNTDPEAGSFYFNMARKKSDYEPRGKSILQRCIRWLVFRDKVRQSLTSIASRHMTPYRVVYGEDMSLDQVEELREQVDMALQDPDYSIITNFPITWEENGADQRLPDWSWVFDFTDRQMYAGLGVTESMLSGEASYSGDRINLEIINQRFMLNRERLQELVENQFFKPMCRRMGFIEYDEYGNEEVIVPKLSFTRLSFRDNTETFDALLNLYQKGSLDVDTILEHLNLDPQTVREKLLQDFATIQDGTFNEILRSLYSRIGDELADVTTITEKVAEYLGLNIRQDEDNDADRF